MNTKLLLPQFFGAVANEFFRTVLERKDPQWPAKGKNEHPATHFPHFPYLGSKTSLSPLRLTVDTGEI